MKGKFDLTSRGRLSFYSDLLSQQDTAESNNFVSMKRVMDISGLDYTDKPFYSSCCTTCCCSFLSHLHSELLVLQSLITLSNAFSTLSCVTLSFNSMIHKAAGSTC